MFFVVIGLGYVLETVVGKGELFICELCDMRSNLNNMVLHIIGLKHRLAYLVCRIFGLKQILSLILACISFKQLLSLVLVYINVKFSLRSTMVPADPHQIHTYLSDISSSVFSSEITFCLRWTVKDIYTLLCI